MGREGGARRQGQKKPGFLKPPLTMADVHQRCRELDAQSLEAVARGDCELWTEDFIARAQRGPVDKKESAEAFDKRQKRESYESVKLWVVARATEDASRVPVHAALTDPFHARQNDAEALVAEANRNARHRHRVFLRRIGDKGRASHVPLVMRERSAGVASPDAAADAADAAAAEGAASATKKTKDDAAPAQRRPEPAEIMWFVPNLIGYVRLACLFACFTVFQGCPWTVTTLYCVQLVLDYWDGFFARRLGQCTVFGAWFDVFVDNVGRALLYMALSSPARAGVVVGADSIGVGRAPVISPQWWVPAWGAIVLVEWTTFIAIQAASATASLSTRLAEAEQTLQKARAAAADADTASGGGGERASASHWKESAEAQVAPRIVQLVMARGFKTPWGVLVMGSIHLLPIFLFACATPPLWAAWVRGVDAVLALARVELCHAWVLDRLVLSLLLFGRALGMICEWWYFKSFALSLLRMG